MRRTARSAGRCHRALRHGDWRIAQSAFRPQTGNRSDIRLLASPPLQRVRLRSPAAGKAPGSWGRNERRAGRRPIRGPPHPSGRHSARGVCDGGRAEVARHGHGAWCWECSVHARRGRCPTHIRAVRSPATRSENLEVRGGRTEDERGASGRRRRRRRPLPRLVRRTGGHHPRARLAQTPAQTRCDSHRPRTRWRTDVCGGSLRIGDGNRDRRGVRSRLGCSDCDGTMAGTMYPGSHPGQESRMLARSWTGKADGSEVRRDRARCRPCRARRRGTLVWSRLPASHKTGRGSGSSGRQWMIRSHCCLSAGRVDGGAVCLHSCRRMQPWVDVRGCPYAGCGRGYFAHPERWAGRGRKGACAGGRHGAAGVRRD